MFLSHGSVKERATHIVDIRMPWKGGTHCCPRGWRGGLRMENKGQASSHGSPLLSRGGESAQQAVPTEEQTGSVVTQ